MQHYIFATSLCD